MRAKGAEFASPRSRGEGLGLGRNSGAAGDGGVCWKRRRPKARSALVVTAPSPSPAAQACCLRQPSPRKRGEAGHAGWNPARRRALTERAARDPGGRCSGDRSLPPSSLVATGSAARAAKISIACSALGKEYELCKSGAEAWAKKTGNDGEVRLDAELGDGSPRALPADPGGRCRRTSTSSRSTSSGRACSAAIFIDLTPLTADRRLKAAFPGRHRKRHGRRQARRDAVVHRCRVALLSQGSPRRLQARPCRRPGRTSRRPRSGSRMASARRARGDVWGFVFQARAYEGLTVNALEWIASHGGGTIIDAKGEVTVDNPKAIAALTRPPAGSARSAPEGVLNYTEEESRGVFQSGNAVFMRNWPYAWALAQGAGQPHQGQGRHRAPAEGRRRRSSMPRHSAGRNSPSRSTRRIPTWRPISSLYLTGAQEQKRRAVAGSFNPTIPASSRIADIVKAAPFIGELARGIRRMPLRARRAATGRQVQQGLERRILQCRRTATLVEARASLTASLAALDTRPEAAQSRRPMVRPVRLDGLARALARSAWLLPLPMLAVLALVARLAAFAHDLVRPHRRRRSTTSALPLRRLRQLLAREDGEWIGLLADPDWWRAVFNTLWFTARLGDDRDVLGFAVALTSNARFPAAASARRRADSLGDSDRRFGEDVGLDAAGPVRCHQ